MSLEFTQSRFAITDGVFRYFSNPVGLFTEQVLGDIDATRARIKWFAAQFLARLVQFSRSGPPITPATAMALERRPDMSFLQKAIFPLFAVIGLNACSLTLKLSILNNTGLDAKVLVGNQSSRISDQSAADFDYPSIESQRRIQILLGGCLYEYQIPEEMQQYSKLPGFDGKVVVQLESDAQIFAVPPASRGVVDIQELATLQLNVPPIAPLKSECSESL